MTTCRSPKVSLTILLRAVSLLCLLVCLLCQVASAQEVSVPVAPPTPLLTRPVVGAIRWDAWHGDRGVPGRAVQTSLGPEEWHGRLPFFGKVLSDDTVSIDGASQGVMDQEIGYARAGGLDYWAFVTYPETDPMSLGLKFYLSSKQRSQIHFCLVTECDRWQDPTFIARLVSLLSEPGYQTVLDKRSLLYLGFIDPTVVQRDWGGMAGLRKVLDDFRAAVVNHGSPTPYLVILDFDAAEGKRFADALGGDAVSSYAVPGQGHDVPFADLARHTEAFWDACAATGAQVVPIVMTGWDRRPRVAHPVPWEPEQKPGVGLDQFDQPPTPAELSAHMRHALEWLRLNRAQSLSQAALIYAWNENDEGGWLVPTLSEGHARLDALASVLHEPAVSVPLKIPP